MQKIVLVGAGALGCEFAGLILQFHPEKEVTLVARRACVYRVSLLLLIHAVLSLWCERFYRVLSSLLSKELGSCSVISEGSERALAAAHQRHCRLVTRVGGGRLPA